MGEVRVDLIAVVWNWSSSSCGSQCFPSRWRRCILSWAVLRPDLLSLFMSWVVVVSRNWKVCVADMKLLDIVRKGQGWGVSPEADSHLHSLVRVQPRWFWPRQGSSCSTSCRSADSSPFWTSPVAVASTAILKSLTAGWVEVHWSVSGEKNNGERAHLEGPPVITVFVPDMVSPSLTCYEIVLHWPIFPIRHLHGSPSAVPVMFLRLVYHQSLKRPQTEENLNLLHRFVYHPNFRKTMFR